MRSGKDLLELISKVLLFIVFGCMLIGLFIPEGKGLPLMFGGVFLFFFYPLIESALILYYKWLYRNIIVAEGYLNEEVDMWEHFKIRILNVIPFESLPETLHNAYLNNIEEYYTEQIRDKTLDEINKRFMIDEKTLTLKPSKPIDYKKLKELEDKQKRPLDYREEDYEDYEEGIDSD